MRIHWTGEKSAAKGKLLTSKALWLTLKRTKIVSQTPLASMHAPLHALDLPEDFTFTSNHVKALHWAHSRYLRTYMQRAGIQPEGVEGLLCAEHLKVVKDGQRVHMTFPAEQYTTGKKTFELPPYDFEFVWVEDAEEQTRTEASASAELPSKRQRLDTGAVSSEASMSPVTDMKFKEMLQIMRDHHTAMSDMLRQNQDILELLARNATATDTTTLDVPCDYSPHDDPVAPPQVTVPCPQEETVQDEFDAVEGGAAEVWDSRGSVLQACFDVVVYIFYF
ncbi:hypothetical protein HDU77_007175 [Chytriomyces hyalinus]|nr:hypothetical protein HDU77_007175 [Chytriomyces hyalinus]